MDPADSSYILEIFWYLKLDILVPEPSFRFRAWHVERVNVNEALLLVYEALKLLLVCEALMSLELLVYEALIKLLVYAALID